MKADRVLILLLNIQILVNVYRLGSTPSHRSKFKKMLFTIEKNTSALYAGGSDTTITYIFNSLETRDSAFISKLEKSKNDKYNEGLQHSDVSFIYYIGDNSVSYTKSETKIITNHLDF